MDRKVLAALEELRKGIIEERDGIFPHDQDFYKWADNLIRKAEEEIKDACSLRI